MKTDMKKTAEKTDDNSKWPWDWKKTQARSDVKNEYDGLKIRPVFPQEKIKWHKPQMLGPTEEELLTELYYDHSKWLEEMKTVCKRAGILLEQHLRKAL